MMQSVVNKIEDLGVEVCHISGGCTGLCQPIDVRIGKPFKNWLRTFWEQWMIENGLQLAITSPPSFKNKLVHWCLDSFCDTDITIIRNSWRHGDYSYFTDNR